MRATGNKQIFSYRLSIRIKADGFSVYTHTTQGHAAPQREFIPSETGRKPADTLRRELNRLLAVHVYDEVELIVDSPTTRVPLEEFHRQETAALLQLTFPRLQAVAEEIRYEILPHLEVVEIYSVSHEIVETVQEIFPGALIHGIQGMMMEQAVSKDVRRNSTPVCMHADRCDQGLFLFAVQGRQLKFACTYPCDEDKDGLYFLLSAWKALEMKVASDVCVLHRACHSLGGRARQFIKNVELCE